MTPFYSIEAWLYQHTSRVRELCQQRCGKHLELIDGWERDRLLLDEIDKPKKLICIQNDENHDLANGFTHQLAGELYLLAQASRPSFELLGTALLATAPTTEKRSANEGQPRDRGRPADPVHASARPPPP